MGLKKKVDGQWVDDSGIKDPMSWEGVITLTADSADTTKCSISVSAPASAADIKGGFIYKVSSIASSPAYTGTLKIGDMFVAAKDAPVVTAAWVEDTDWNIIPSGDEPEYTAAAGGGLQLTGEFHNEFGHSNTPITPKTDLGIVKVKYDALGHITESEDALTDTAVTGLVTATPTDPDPANKITYYSYANERLTLHKIGYTTDNRFVSTKEPLRVVSRYVDFTTNDTTRTGNPDIHPVYMAINRCNVADDGTINAYYGDAGYVEDGSNGQVMVKIPKFYYKVTPITFQGTNSISEGKWEISDSLQSGFRLHPAFYDAAGNEIDYFLYGAFEAVCQKEDGSYTTSMASGKLSSIGGNLYKPATGSRNLARLAATKRGAGWYANGIKQLAAIQMLMGVEFGFNSQETIGNGNTNNSVILNCGTTTGNITSGSTADYRTAVNYRGIENLWGNTYQMVDGINFLISTMYVCNNYNFVDDTSSGYSSIGFSSPSGTGYIDMFGYTSNDDWCLLPNHLGGNANSAIGDYFNKSSDYTYSICTVGGSNSNDVRCGAFHYAFSYKASSSSNVLGSRIMYIPSAI